MVSGQLWDDRVYIPRAAMPLCTKGVLVMERLPGVPMVAGLKKQFGAIAESHGQTLAELEADREAQIEAGTLKKMSLSEDAAQFGIFNRMLRWKRYATAPFQFCWNCSLGLVPPLRWEAVEGMGCGPGGELLSLGELLTTLADVSRPLFFHSS